MARKPDTPCARCGKLLWSGKGVLPAGERTCRSCRRENPKPYGPSGPRDGVAYSRGAERYGREHLLARRQLLPAAIDKPCPICGDVMLVDQPLDLDHSVALRVDPTPRPGDRIVHTSCNRGWTRVADRKCVICGEPYHPRDAGQRACSRACGIKLRSLVMSGEMSHSENYRRNHREPGRYGNEHQKLRKQWKIKVDAGQVCCARCGKWIEPGTPWDLGHDDADRSNYHGPEHASCNRATSAHKAKRRRRTSRNW